MQAALPRAVGHHAARELVDDLHLAVDDDVVLIAIEAPQRAQSLLDELAAPRRGAPHAAERVGRALGHLLAGGSYPDLAVRAQDEVLAAAHSAREVDRCAEQLAATPRCERLGDDERRS